MTKKLLIEGMSCAHCVKHVEDALKELKGVVAAKANLDDKSALVELSQDIAEDVIREAIEDAGYDLVEVQPLS